MAKVTLETCRKTMKKAALTDLQVEILHIPREEAKINSETLAGNKAISFDIEDEWTAIEFHARAEKLGIVGKLIGITAA